jgi:subtilisin-like proprotein convertase family protein
LSPYGQPLSGTYAPQAGSLASFDGLDPNGAWTFFIADEQPGGVGELLNWSLEVTGTEATTVPDTGSAFELLGLGASSLALWSRRNRQVGASR